MEERFCFVERRSKEISGDTSQLHFAEVRFCSYVFIIIMNNKINLSGSKKVKMKFLKEEPLWSKQNDIQEDEEDKNFYGQIKCFKTVQVG